MLVVFGNAKISILLHKQGLGKSVTRVLFKGESMDFANYQKKLDELKSKLNEAQTIFNELQNIAEITVIDNGTWQDEKKAANTEGVKK